MDGKLSVMVFGLALLCASLSSLGNAAAQGRGAYGYCYAGTPDTVYFSRAFVVDPNPPAPRVRFERYLTEHYGFHGAPGQCVISNANSAADATHDEATRETWFPNRRIIHVGWTEDYRGAPTHQCTNAEHAHGAPGC